MQAYNHQDEPVGPAVPVPDTLDEFSAKARDMLRQPGADKLKIFVPVEELKKLSPTQKLLFELRNKAKVVVERG